MHDHVKETNDIQNIVQAMSVEGEVRWEDFLLEGSSEWFQKTVKNLQSIHARLITSRQMNEHLTLLHEFGRIFSTEYNEEMIYEKAWDSVSQVMPTDSFVFAIFHPEQKIIEVSFAADNGERIPYIELPLGDNILTQVIKRKEPIHYQTNVDLVNPYVVLGEYHTNACIFVPLLVDGEVKAIISAQSFQHYVYTKEHEELLRIIGYQVYNAVEKIRFHERLVQQSMEDELTRLHNRRAFHQDSEELLQQEKPFTLMMIDSDFLKKTNDVYGHHVGDQYIRTIAEGIRSITQEDGMGYRYAGDEFMVIFEGDSQDKVRERFHQLETFFQEHSIQTASGDFICVSISAGVSRFPSDGKTLEALKMVADKALYHSKYEGRNLCSDRNGVIFKKVGEQHVFYI